MCQFLGERDHGNRTACFEGTIFDGLHPRLVRVGDYEIESPLKGHLYSAGMQISLE